MLVGVLALANGVCWYSVYAVVVRWHDGPDIGQLMDSFPNRYDGYRALLDHLVAVHDDHRSRNELIVDLARRLVLWQVLCTFAGISLLVGALLTLG